MRNLWEGADGARWLQELSGCTKIIVILAFSLLVITVDNPRTLFVLFTLTLLAHLLGKTSLQKWQALAVLLLLGLWGSMLSQAMFYSQTPRTVMLELISPNCWLLGRLTGGLFIYQEGIVYGAVQGLRSSTMLSLGLLVCWNSDPRQLLKSLMGWGMSPQIAFMLVTAMRFLPVLAAEAGEVLVALRLRSADVEGRKATFRYVPYILKPLLVRCLRRSQTLALSVVSRGFFLAKNKPVREPWRLRERLSCYGLIFFTLGIVVSKVLYMLSEQGLYFGVLRCVYDWTKMYL